MIESGRMVQCFEGEPDLARRDLLTWAAGCSRKGNLALVMSYRIDRIAMEELLVEDFGADMEYCVVMDLTKDRAAPPAYHIYEPDRRFTAIFVDGGLTMKLSYYNELAEYLDASVFFTRYLHWPMR